MQTNTEIIDGDSDINRINHGILKIEKNGLFKSDTQLFFIGQHLLFKAQSSVLQTGTFRIWTKNPDCLSIGLGYSTLPKTTGSQWQPVGSVSSPGLLFDRTMVRDHNHNAKVVMVYNNTSRTGDLMNLKVAIPRIRRSRQQSLSRIISTLCNLPADCANLIVEHLDLFWTETIDQDVDTANCHRLIRTFSRRSDSKVMVLRNKLPTWNSQINAYTLEFGGRALVPSVHNFQLIDSDDRVVLQLGKSCESKYNIDFSFPLTPYQAFCICLSVIDRTFVWD